MKHRQVLLFSDCRNISLRLCELETHEITNLKTYGTTESFVTRGFLCFKYPFTRITASYVSSYAHARRCTLFALENTVEVIAFLLKAFIYFTTYEDAVSPIKYSEILTTQRTGHTCSLMMRARKLYRALRALKKNL